jgi:hypothetical protein
MPGLVKQVLASHTSAGDLALVELVTAPDRRESNALCGEPQRRTADARNDPAPPLLP